MDGVLAPLPPLSLPLAPSLSLVSEATIQIKIQVNGRSRDAPVGVFFFLVFLLFFSSEPIFLQPICVRERESSSRVLERERERVGARVCAEGEGAVCVCVCAYPLPGI